MKRTKRWHSEEEEEEQGEEGFVGWEERVISATKGKREVHYYLTHSPSGTSVLSVTGTERSLRHMTYTLPHPFVLLFGDLCNVSSSTKWRARRHVLHWLDSTVSRHRRLLLQKSTCALEPPLYDKNCGHHLIPGLTEMPARKLKSQISEIVWNGVGWACCKQLMHYHSFRRNGVDIKVHSFVFIMAAEGNHYVGYIEDMYEDKKAQKRVKVRWFHCAEEIIGLDSEVDAHPREVFITPQVQVISAECINGPASVLTLKDYEQCVAVLPHSILNRVHLCFRQLKNNVVSPFSVMKLQGYCNQPVLACINHPLFSNDNAKAFDEGKLKDSTIGTLKRSHKKRRLDGDLKGRNHSMMDYQFESCRLETSPSVLMPSYPKLKIKLSGRGLKLGNFVGCQQELSATFNINDDIELLCQDSGIRGCWFRCKVLRVSSEHLKVEYYDLEDAENSGNLQEWVGSCRVAASDKLGMRYAGRLTARPRPPENSNECFLKVGAPVDIWWYDGWWEGVVTKTTAFGTGHLQIYLPGEDRYVTVEKSQVRTAKDWVNGLWLDAKMKPDILSCISAKVNHHSISEYQLHPISELAEFKEDTGDPTNPTADHPVLTSFQEDVTLEMHFCGEEVAAEVGKQALELLSCNTDSDFKGDGLDVESDVGCARKQYSEPLKYVKVPVVS